MLLAFWVRSERAVGVRFAGQFMLATSWTYMIFYLLVLVISIAGIGEIKLAQLALGPVTVMAAGLQSALIALAAERFQRVDPRRHAVARPGWPGHGRRHGGLERRRLRDAGARHDERAGPDMAVGAPARPVHGTQLYLQRFRRRGNSGLRAMRAARENMRLALLMLPFLLLFFMGGAVLFGTQGATGGLAASMGMYAVLAWWLLIRTTRRFVPGTDQVVEDPVVEMAEP